MSAPSSFRVNTPVANATVGKSVIIKGQILSREDLTIEGEVEGTIDIPEHRLTIAAGGKVGADVNARELDVIGSMRGKIEAAEKVYVRDGANVVGDIHSAGIIVEDGAYIKGGIDLTIPHAGHPVPKAEGINNGRSDIGDLAESVFTS
jgi:cytoskeletal protein CcmA (bactofilin family)